MREIKFRGWDKELNFMINIKRYKIDFNGQVLFDNNDKELYNQTNKIELMQYTGLKDKNGVEIYEGDIIKDGSRLWKIEISPIYGIFFILTKGGHSRCYGDFGSYLVDEFKVIGNIYENPELLESK